MTAWTVVYQTPEQPGVLSLEVRAPSAYGARLIGEQMLICGASISAAIVGFRIMDVRERP